MKYLVAISLFIIQPWLLQAQYFDLREGNNKYLAGDYAEAKRRYDKIIAEEKTLDRKKEAIFNSGNALYRMKKFDDAESDYRTIAENTTLNPVLRADAYYNIGNSYFSRAKAAQGEPKSSLLTAAIQHYKKSLKLNPNDLQAKQNLELAKALLKQEENPQGSRQNNQQDKDQPQNNRNPQDKNQPDQHNNKDTAHNQNQQNQQDNPDNPKDSKPESTPGTDGKAHISKANAEQLLDALKQDEKQMLRKYLMKKSSSTKYEKDW